MWVWPLETAAREAVQQPMKVGAGSTVADVTVRPDDLVRRLLHTRPRERLPIDVMQSGGQRWPCQSGPPAFECPVSEGGCPQEEPGRPPVRPLGCGETPAGHRHLGSPG